MWQRMNSKHENGQELVNQIPIFTFENAFLSAGSLKDIFLFLLFLLWLSTFAIGGRQLNSWSVSCHIVKKVHIVSAETFSGTSRPQKCECLLYLSNWLCCADFKALWGKKKKKKTYLNNFDLTKETQRFKQGLHPHYKDPGTPGRQLEIAAIGCSGKGISVWKD